MATKVICDKCGKTWDSRVPGNVSFCVLEIRDRGSKYADSWDMCDSCTLLFTTWVAKKVKKKDHGK